MKHGVGRSARGHHARDGVLEALARDERARRDARVHQLHDAPAALEGDLFLARVDGRDAVPAHGRHAEHLVGGGHGVGRELPSAGARARAGVILDVLQLGRRDLAGVVGADRLEHVLDGQVPVRERTGRSRAAPEHDRAAVEHEARDVQPPQDHGHGGDGLVAAGDRHEAVEHVATRDQLHRIGDHLAADEGTLHPLGAHGDAVGDGDGVDLDGRASGGADPLHHLFGELPVVPVARHGADPGMGDPDLRLREVPVGEAHGLHHGAGGGAVGALEEDAALVARIVGHFGTPLANERGAGDSTGGRGAEPANSPASRARRSSPAELRPGVRPRRARRRRRGDRE